MFARMYAFRSIPAGADTATPLEMPNASDPATKTSEGLIARVSAASRFEISPHEIVLTRTGTSASQAVSQPPPPASMNGLAASKSDRGGAANKHAGSKELEQTQSLEQVAESSILMNDSDRHGIDELDVDDPKNDDRRNDPPPAGQETDASRDNRRNREDLAALPRHDRQRVNRHAPG